MKNMKALLMSLATIFLSLSISAFEITNGPPTVKNPSARTGGFHMRGVLFFNLDTFLNQERHLSLEPIPEFPEEDYYRHRVDQLGRDLHELGQMKFVQVPETTKWVWSSEERIPDLQISHFTPPHFTPLVAVSFPLIINGETNSYRLNLSSEESYELILSMLKKISTMFLKNHRPKFEFHIFLDAHQPLQFEASFENTLSGLQIKLSSPRNSAASRFIQISTPRLKKCGGLFN